MIICRKCKKEDQDFRHNRRVCKNCEKEQGREYRKNTTKAKEWSEANKDKMKYLQSEWYKANKPKINTKFQERYHGINSNFKLIKNYRTAVSRMIIGNQKTNKYIGCQVDFLKEWCKFCLVNDMTMDNYPKIWVVDHVIPLDKIDKYGFEVLAKWYNIMPVHTLYNLQKNKFIDNYQLTKHKENLEKFCKLKKLKLDQEYIQYLQDCLMRELP